MHRDPIATANEWRAKAEAENLTTRELIIEVTGRQNFIGSPSTVAETINHLVQADASDGFILVPHVTPGGLDPFVDRVVPAAAGARRVPDRLHRDHAARPPRAGSAASARGVGRRSAVSQAR